MLLQKPVYVENEFFLFAKEHEKGCAPHFHKYAEIILSDCNNLDIHIGTHQLRQLNPNEILVIPPKQVHAIYNKNVDQMYNLLQIDLDKLFLLFSPCPYIDYINPLFFESISNVVYQGAIVDEITHIFNKIENRFEIKYIGDVIHIINMLNKNIPEDVFNSGTSGRNMKFYSALNEIMESEPIYNLNLDYLSEKFFMSKSTFQRQVKKCIGLSFHTWLQKCRMQKAVTELRNNVPISEIALSLGFSSVSHFSKTFKTYYGITPKESRNCEQSLKFIK